MDKNLSFSFLAHHVNYVYCAMLLLFERIINSPASLSDSEVRQSISDAFHVWSDASRLSFHELRSGHADITIQFFTGLHGDGFPFDGPGETMCATCEV